VPSLAPEMETQECDSRWMALRLSRRREGIGIRGGQVYNWSASASTNTSISKLVEDVEDKASEHGKGNGREREDEKEVDYNGYVR
jgi:hypothetical protein